jgi:hypothetical protein
MVNIQKDVENLWKSYASPGHMIIMIYRWWFFQIFPGFFGDARPVARLYVVWPLRTEDLEPHIYSGFTRLENGNFP